MPLKAENTATQLQETEWTDRLTKATVVNIIDKALQTAAKIAPDEHISSYIYIILVNLYTSTAQQILTSFENKVKFGEFLPVLNGKSRIIVNLWIQDKHDMRIPTYCQHLKHRRHTVGMEHSTESFPANEQLTLAHYGIVNGSKLHLSRSCGCSFFEIFVEIVDGRIEDIISLHVSLADTVFAIKQLIQEKTNIPVFRQCLTLEGRPLKDTSMVLNCRIVSFSTLELHLVHEN